VELLGACLVRVADDRRLRKAGIGVDLPVQGKDVLHTGEDQRIALVLQDRPEALVDLLEVAQDVFLRVHFVCPGRRTPGTRSPRRGGAGTQALSCGIDLERLIDVPGQPLGPGLLHPVARAHQQPHVLLAQGQHVETAFRVEQGKQGLDVEPFGQDDRREELHGKPVGPEKVGAQEEGQAV